MHLTSCDICQLAPPGAALASLSLPFEKNHCPNLSQSVPYCPLSFLYGFVWLQRVPHCFMIFLFCPPTCSGAAFAESEPASNGKKVYERFQNYIIHLYMHGCIYIYAWMYIYIYVYIYICIYIYIQYTNHIRPTPAVAIAGGGAIRQRSIGSGKWATT